MKESVVYYYCNENTFNSIIQSGKIWLTSIWDLNDPSEIHWTFKKNWNDIQGELRQNASSLQIELLDSINYEVESEVYRNNMYYIICFSKYKDLLSQWRGYADNGKGYSVGIDLSKITELNDIPRLNVDYKKALGYVPVIYNPNDQYNGLLAIFRQILNMEIQSGPLVTGIVNLLMHSLIFKNPYYFEENEVRLIFAGLINDGKISNLDNAGILNGPFKHTNSICDTTHVEIDLMKCDLSGCIEEVVLGPKNTVPIETIYHTMCNNGFVIDKGKIVNSKGMYR